VHKEVRKNISIIKVVIPIVPILTLLVEGKKSTIYSATSKHVLGYALMQENKLVVYASRQLKPYEWHYITHNLGLVVMILCWKYEVIACVWSTQ